jgi:predicted Rossmann-fold nucleotide-binding protein
MKRLQFFVAQVRKRWDSYGASNIARTNFSKKIQVVYGGSNVGLMRALADGALRRDSDRRAA